MLFAGTPEAALPVLHALMDSTEHEVVGVLTRADTRCSTRAITALAPLLP